jgi:4-diphosphocytidyl-2-C-methyl-D-erythritol kinase
VTEAVRLAPAKVNLGLRVVGRRPDGYHLLESLFTPLDLADVLRIGIEPAGATAVEVRLAGAAAGVPGGGENLAARAARRFLDAAGLAAEVAIDLEKRIPVGAGLGGGSSDAAAVLRALVDRFANTLSSPKLAEIALELGADVPFFLDPQPAWVTGIGERIEPVDDVPALDLLLVTPAPPLATAAVFRAYDAALTPAGHGRRMPALRNGPGRILNAAIANERADEVGHASEARRELRELLTNDLTSAASRLHPGIDRVRAELERLGARAVAMSGSGPTVFGIFASAEQARAARTEGRFDTTDRVLVARTHGAAAESARAGSKWGVV